MKERRAFGKTLAEFTDCMQDCRHWHEIEAAVLPHAQAAVLRTRAGPPDRRSMAKLFGVEVGA